MPDPAVYMVSQRRCWRVAGPRGAECPLPQRMDQWHPAPLWRLPCCHSAPWRVRQPPLGYSPGAILLLSAGCQGVGAGVLQQLRIVIGPYYEILNSYTIKLLSGAERRLGAGAHTYMHTHTHTSIHDVDAMAM